MFVGRSTTVVLLCCTLIAVLHVGPTAGMSLDRLRLDQNSIQAETPADYSGSGSSGNANANANANSNSNAAVIVDDMELEAVPAGGNTEMFVLVPAGGASERDSIDRNVIESAGSMGNEEDAMEPVNGADMLMMESNDVPVMDVIALPPVHMTDTTAIVEDESENAIITNKMDKTPIEIMVVADNSAPSAPAEATASDFDAEDSLADGESESMAELIAEAVEEAEKDFVAEMTDDEESANAEEPVKNEAENPLLTVDPIEKLEDDVLVNLIEKEEVEEEPEMVSEDSVIEEAIKEGLSDIIDDIVPAESSNSVVQAIVEASGEEDKSVSVIQTSPEVAISETIVESVATNNIEAVKGDEKLSHLDINKNANDSADQTANTIAKTEEKSKEEQMKEILSQAEVQPNTEPDTILEDTEKINSGTELKNKETNSIVEAQVQANAESGMEVEETNENVGNTEVTVSQPVIELVAEESQKEEAENEPEDKLNQNIVPHELIEEANQLEDPKLDATILSETDKQEAVQSLDIIKDEIINEIELEEIAEVEKDLAKLEEMEESQPEEHSEPVSFDSKAEEETDIKHTEEKEANSEQNETISTIQEESQTVEKTQPLQQENFDSAPAAHETAEETEEIKHENVETSPLTQENPQTDENTQSIQNEDVETSTIVQDEQIKVDIQPIQQDIETAPVVQEEPHILEGMHVDTAPEEAQNLEESQEKVETTLDAQKLEQIAAEEIQSTKPEVELSPITHDEQSTSEEPQSVQLEEMQIASVNEDEQTDSESMKEVESESAHITEDKQPTIEGTESIKENASEAHEEVHTIGETQENTAAASLTQDEQSTAEENQTNEPTVIQVDATQLEETQEINKVHVTHDAENKVEVEVPQTGADNKHDVLAVSANDQNAPAAIAEQQIKEDLNDTETDTIAEADVEPEEQQEVVKPESVLANGTANIAADDPVPTQQLVENPQQPTSEDIKPTSILTTIVQVPQQVPSTVEEPASPTNAISAPVMPTVEGSIQVPLNVMDSVLNYVNASLAQHNNQQQPLLATQDNEDEVFSSKLRRYDGAQVWRIVVQNDRDKRLADELQTKYDGQVWKEVKQEIDYLLKPQVLAEAARHIRAANLSRTVLIDNLQRVIEVENPSAAEIAQLQNRKGHRMTWQAYHRLEDIHGYFDYLAKTYPDICSVETIGYSVQKRPLKILKISNGNADNPGFWMDGGMHAREWISPASVTYIANQIVEGWDDLPPYMRNINWYMHAVANPDGYEYSHTTDRLWRKNMRSHGRQCPGVDLNRNFGYKWGGKGTSANPCAQTYRGSKAFSEPETFYISKFISNFPRDTFHAYISFHSYGQYILYPWGYDYHLTKDRSDLDRVGRQAGTTITKTSGVKYTVGSSATTLYPAAGASDDWAKGFAGIKYTYTIEMGDTGRYGFVLPAKFIEYNGKDGYTFVETVARAIKLGNDSRKRAIHK